MQNYERSTGCDPYLEGEEMGAYPADSGFTELEHHDRPNGVRRKWQAWGRPRLAATIKITRSANGS